MTSNLSTRTIDLRLDNEVLHLTFNRPDVFNALSTEMIGELINVFSCIDEIGARLIVMRGAGGNFCAGADLGEMMALIDIAQKWDIEAIAGHNAEGGKLLAAVDKCPVPVVAILEGAVYGGGVGIACAVDIAVATSTVSFGLPETNLGLVPAQISPYVKRRVGESNARLIALLGGRFDAARAQELGMVHFLVNNEEQLGAVMTELIERILASPPKALATAKQLMTGGIEAMDPVSLGALFARHMISEEGQEGTSAFAEKRKPKWYR